MIKSVTIRPNSWPQSKGYFHGILSGCLPMPGDYEQPEVGHRLAFPSGIPRSGSLNPSVRFRTQKSKVS